jgi:hypothetical protein
MFDNFLRRLTEKLTSFAALSFNKNDAYSKYKELDYDEKMFIDLLLLQVQNNVTTVRKYSKSSVISKPQDSSDF